MKKTIRYAELEFYSMIESAIIRASKTKRQTVLWFGRIEGSKSNRRTMLNRQIEEMMP